MASKNPPAEPPAAEGQEIPKKYERQVPFEQQDPAVRFRQAKAESDAHGEWGSGEGGYKPPKSASEKMRKNLPYKVMLPCVCTESSWRLTGTLAVQVPSELGRFLVYKRHILVVSLVSVRLSSIVSYLSNPWLLAIVFL